MIFTPTNSLSGQSVALNIFLLKFFTSASRSDKFRLTQKALKSSLWAMSRIGRLSFHLIKNFRSRSVLLKTVLSSRTVKGRLFCKTENSKYLPTVFVWPRITCRLRSCRRNYCCSSCWYRLLLFCWRAVPHPWRKNRNLSWKMKCILLLVTLLAVVDAFVPRFSAALLRGIKGSNQLVR